MKVFLPLLGFCLLVSSCGIFVPFNTERPDDRRTTTTRTPRTPRPAPTATGSDRADRTTHIRADITAHADELLGLRYKFGGNNPRQGFDCSGFVLYLYQNAGVDIERVSREQAKQGRKIDPKKARPGDLVFFRRSGQPVHHVSVIKEADANRLVVIHATNSGVIEEDIMRSRYWKPLLYQVRNVLD